MLASTINKCKRQATDKVRIVSFYIINKRLVSLEDMSPINQQGKDLLDKWIKTMIRMYARKEAGKVGLYSGALVRQQLFLTQFANSSKQLCCLTASQ